MGTGPKKLPFWREHICWTIMLIYLLAAVTVTIAVYLNSSTRSQPAEPEAPFDASGDAASECSLTAAKVDLLGQIPDDPALSESMQCWIPLQSASFEVVGVGNGLVMMRYRSLCNCHGAWDEGRPPQLGADCPSPATVAITLDRLRSWPLNEDIPSCRERWQRLVYEAESFR